MNRVIFHCDCNAFFASVEECLHPELKKVPMAVCGNPENRRGIILAKNELAKSFKVQTAETIWQARQKCPGLVLAPVRHDLYYKYSNRVNDIYIQYTDRLERFGIDESFLDVSGTLHLFGGDPVRLAHEIRQRVEREVGITISVGVSYNKIFAKIGSDYKKPNAVTVISKDNYREIVWPLPAGDLFFVGKVTRQQLERLNIFTIGDLAGYDKNVLRSRLGKLGEQLYLYANGLDDSPVVTAEEGEGVHSIGNGMTFRRNLVTHEDIQTGVSALCDSVAARMRRAGLKALTVQVTIKDTYLKVITRQKTLSNPTFLAKTLSRQSVELIEKAWKIGTPIRMLTVTASHLVPADATGDQLSLFEAAADAPNLGQERQEKLEQAMDRIRDKYGRDSITRASIVDNDLGIDHHYGSDDDNDKQTGTPHAQTQ